MNDYTRLEKVFKPEWVSPYSDAQFLSDIAVMRKEFNGTLFIDRVLKTFMPGTYHPASPNSNELYADCCVFPASQYPPEDKPALKKFHAQVCSSDLMSVPHKLSVFYYILLDFDDLQTPGRTNYAENFAFNFAVPEKYRIFMKGLWLMDRREFSVRPPIRCS